MNRFAPELLLEEQLVLAADAHRGGGRIWSMRRPRPDGRGYACELWHRPPGGGAPARVPLAFSLTAAPRYLTDGRVAVVGADDGDPQLWRAALDGSPPERLTTDLHVLDAEPAPDGRLIAFRAFAGEQRFLIDDDVARRLRSPVVFEDGSGFRDRWVHAFAWRDGEVVQLTRGALTVRACGWSEDGSELWLLIGVADQRPYETHELWTLRPGAEPRPLVRDPGAVIDVALSPDAAHLAWIARREPWSHTHLYVLDRSSGRTTRLDAGLCVDQATFPDVLPPVGPGMQLGWTHDGGAVLAIATVRGRPTLYRFPLRGEPQVALPGVAVGFLRRTPDTTLLVGSAGPEPADALELDGESARPLSAHRRWLPEPLLAKISELSTRQSGVEVHGWIVEPESGLSAAAPLILHVHGGPYSAHGPLPWLEMIALASHGYGVLVPNPRGSVSYGERHSGAIVGRWGSVDADDLHAFLDAALERGLGDAGRLGVLGMSYGGFMAVHLAATSERFAAAVAENPVTNLVTEFGVSDLGLLGPMLAFGSEEIDLDRWWRASPLRRVHGMTAPLLLLQGEADHRCPPPESMQLYSLLKALGRETELIRFPEESHMMFQLARPDRRVYRLRKILEWFDDHLGRAW